MGNILPSVATSESMNNQTNSPPPKNAIFKISLSVTDTFAYEGALIDSGASAHVIKDASLFTKFEENFSSKKNYIELADGKQMNNIIKGRGEAIIKLNDITGTAREVKLKNALCIPTFTRNIISLSQAIKSGYSFNLNISNSETMTTPEGIIFHIKVINNLYFISNIENSSHQTKKSAKSWHRLLGHNNYADLLKLPSVVTGMYFTDDIQTPECSTCIKSKMTETFSRKPAIRSTKPFQHISTDLNGPIIGSESDDDMIPKYIAGFVDEYSSFVSLYIINRKSDCHLALKMYLADINEFGKPTKLRSDNAKEYESNEFEEILLNRGIKHEFSSPYSPHQNSKIERQWRTLFDMVRALLIDSNVPLKYWPYAVIMAAYLRNRVFNRRLNMTPMEAATGQRPNLNNIQLFGSICYPYIQKKFRKKLDPKSTEAVFLGYDSKSPAYVVLFPIEDRIRKVRECKFTNSYYFEESNNEDKISTHLPKMASSKEEITPDRRSESTPVELDDSARYPIRIRTRTQHYGVDEDHDSDYVSNVHFVFDFNNSNLVIKIPTTYKQAINSPQSEQWIEAMRTQMLVLIENNTFSLVTLPPGA